MSIIKAGNGTKSHLVVRLIILDLSNPLVHKFYPLSTKGVGEGIGVILAKAGPVFEQYWCYAPSSIFHMKADIREMYEEGSAYAEEVFNSDQFLKHYSNTSITALYKFLPPDFVYDNTKTAKEVWEKYFPNIPIATQEQIDAVVEEQGS